MQTISIGPIALPNPVLLAPMSGITDAPFRRMAASLGAGLVISEMTACPTPATCFLLPRSIASDEPHCIASAINHLSPGVYRHQRERGCGLRSHRNLFHHPRDL